MGDLIEVVSTRPLLIRVAGREAEELSMTGEKITLAQVDLALEAAGLGPSRLGLHRPVVWIETGERPRLVWGLPARAGLALDTAWADKLDQALCRLNPLYSEALVRERVIAPSRVAVIPESVFEEAQRASLGISQRKPKRLFKSLEEFSAGHHWKDSP
jgi:hypothetical protein